MKADLKVRKKILMLGAAGMGMLPLAILLHELGHIIFVQDDIEEGVGYEYLKKLSFSISSGIPLGCDLVVYSNAIQKEHSILKEAWRLGIACMRRGEVFSQIVEGKKLIACVGSHGKTTTTGLCIYILKSMGVSFSYYLGGLFQDVSLPPAHMSEGSDWMVAEIDESDGTIDLFNPHIVLIHNLSWDHKNYYDTKVKLMDTFGRFFERTKECILYYGDDENLKAVLSEKVSKTLRTIKYGIAEGEISHDKEGMDYVASIDGGEKKVVIRNKERGLEEFYVNSISTFNIINILGAYVLGKYVGGHVMDSNCFLRFRGIQRRQEVLLNDEIRTICIDYAHHPNELKAFLEFANEHYKSKKKVTIFQPHRYTRTMQYKEEFARVLSEQARNYSEVHLLRTYAAAECKEEGCDSDEIYYFINKKDSFYKMEYWDNNDDLLEYLMDKEESRGEGEKDSVVYEFIGAGDIDKIGRDFARMLREKEILS